MISDRPKQTTSQDLRDDLLAFIRTHFYQDEGKVDFVAFTKDTRHLLAWVVLYPASWFRGRGVTVPASRYKEIVTKILMIAATLGNTESIRYRPAWLGKVIQSHFRIHGEEYYNEAKSARNLAEHALLIAGKAAVRAPDPVAELAAAARLLKATKRRPLSRHKSAVNLDLKLS